MSILVKDTKSEIVNELFDLKSKIFRLSSEHQTNALLFGAGKNKAQEQIPIICAVIDDRAKALEKGLDVNNRSITKTEVKDSLKHLVNATRQPAFIGLISTVLNSTGIIELEKYMDKLENIANKIK